MYHSKLKNKLIKLLICISLFIAILMSSHKNNLPFYIKKSKNESALNSEFIPKISVIIPIYNGGKYLNYSLKSVQKQKMKDIEIIIIDDNSNDDSLKIIQSYMKNDGRIKLIANKINRKILFCKSIGTLNSKGKYILELDQDDMFIRDDAFDIIYNESEKYGLDILNFKFISGENSFLKSKRKNHIRKKNKVIKQPDLKNSMFKTYVFLLWGNLIRADLYKKVIYYLWPIIINYKIVFQEDYLITFFILINSQKHKKIKDILLFHFQNKKSASNGYKNNSEYFLSVIFAGIIFYDYHIDYYPQDFQIILNYINFLKKDFKKAKKLYPSLFNFFFGKIFSNSHLSIKDKNDLKKMLKIPENCCLYKNLNSNLRPNLKETINKEENIKEQSIIFKISIIIIINSNIENISKLINSINAQEFQFFEIILIFDNNMSNNNYDLLKNYSVKKSHIKLLENKTKKGAMFSISKGVMLAKGKYLMILDEKSFFLENIAFDYILEEINKKELDILEFDLYRIFPNNYTYLYKCKHFSSKFNLEQIKYNLEYKDIDINKELLTNKLIKTEFFINCLERYKLKEINEIIDNYYNDIFLFALESTSNKFEHTSLIKIYKNDSDFDKLKFYYFTSKSENIIIKEIIFYIDFIFVNSIDKCEVKENILEMLFNFLSLIYNKFSEESESAKKLLKKFMNSYYISETNKSLLQFYYSSLKSF